ncbi:polymer-forming cytoskeletal protein [Thermodesulfobacteriota bacterium]
MFGSRFRKTKTDAVTGFLGSQTEFAGKLSFSGVVHLDGNFQGEIISRGTLVVGSESVVTAQIQANVLKIAGEVHGDLTAVEKIELYPPAKVYGCIRTPSLVVEEGAFFEGSCIMSPAEQDVPELTDLDSVSSGDEDDLEAISAQAWPPSYEQDEHLGQEPPDEHQIPKAGQ